MIGALKLRRARRRAAGMTFEQASREFRRRVYTGEDADPREVLVLVERALELAPRGDDGVSRSARAGLEKWVEVLRRGHRVKVSTARMVLLEPVDEELAQAVDEAFDEQE